MIPKNSLKMHPNQRDQKTVVVCTADIKDEREIRDSGGHREMRWVIEAPVSIGGETWTIELTLTARDDMLFRMLLGRTAMRGRAIVDRDRCCSFTPRFTASCINPAICRIGVTSIVFFPAVGEDRSRLARPILSSDRWLPNLTVVSICTRRRSTGRTCRKYAPTSPTWRHRNWQSCLARASSKASDSRPSATRLVKARKG